MPSFGKLFVSIGADLSGLTKGLSEAETNLKQINRSVGKLGADFTAAGAKLTAGLTAPILGAGAAAFKFSSDFNKAMANVATLIPGNTARVEELKREVQDLAIETGKSTDDIAGGLYQVISAFGDSADSTQQLEIAAKAATAGLATTEDAINLISATTKGYGNVNAEASQRVSDLAFKVVELGQTTFPELAASMGRVIPLASTLAVSQEELFAAYASLTGVTGSTAEVSTQLAAALQSIIKPSKEMATAIHQTGFETGSALIQAKGLKGAFDALVATTDGSAESIVTMTGRQEALQAVLALTGSQADKFTSSLDTMVNSAGATNKAFDEQTKGVNAIGFTFEQFQVRLTVVAQRLGDALAPAFKAVLDAAEPLIGTLEKAVQYFTQLPQPVQTAVVALAGVAAAAGPVLLGLGQVAFAVQNLITLFPGMATAVTGVISSAGGLTGAMKQIAIGATGMTANVGLASGALVAMGQAAVVAAAAFAAWELGKWAAENIPLVQKLGDVIIALPLALFGDKITGVSEAQEDLAHQLGELDKALRKQGIEIDRGNKTLSEWGKELRKAASELTGSEKKLDAVRAAMKEGAKETSGAEKVLKSFNKELKDTKEKLDDLPKPARYVIQTQEDLEKQTQRITEEWRKLRNDAIEPLTREIPILAQHIEGITQAERDAIQSIGDVTGAFNTQQISMSETELAALNLENAYKALGIKSQEVANNELETLRVALDEIRKQAAEGNPDALAKLSAAEKAYADKLKAQGGAVEATNIWGTALKQVSTVVTDFGKSFADDFGAKLNTGIGIIDNIKDAVLRLISERVFGAMLKNFQTLVDFIPGVKELSGILSGISGGAAVATGAGQAAGEAGSAAGGTASGAAGAAGQAASGALGIINAITGVVSAVSNVITAIYAIRQEGTLNAIELNTRKTSRVLEGDRGEGDLGIIGALFSISETLQFGTFVKVLEQIRDKMGGGSSPAGSQAGPELGYIVGNTDEMKVSLWDIRGILQGFAATGIMVAGLSGAPQAGAAALATPPAELAVSVSRAIDLSELATEFEAAQATASNSLDELRTQTAQLEAIQDAIEAQGPQIVINIQNVNGTDSRAVEAFMKEVERRLRTSTRGIR